MWPLNDAIGTVPTMCEQGTTAMLQLCWLLLAIGLRPDAFSVKGLYSSCLDTGRQWLEQESIFIIQAIMKCLNRTLQMTAVYDGGPKSIPFR